MIHLKLTFECDLSLGVRVYPFRSPAIWKSNCSSTTYCKGCPFSLQYSGTFIIKRVTANSGWRKSTVSVFTADAIVDAALNGYQKPRLPGPVSPGRTGRLGSGKPIDLFAATQHFLLASCAPSYVRRSLFYLLQCWLHPGGCLMQTYSDTWWSSDPLGNFAWE